MLNISFVWSVLRLFTISMVLGLIVGAATVMVFGSIGAWAWNQTFATWGMPVVEWWQGVLVSGLLRLTYLSRMFTVTLKTD